MSRTFADCDRMTMVGVPKRASAAGPRSTRRKTQIQTRSAEEYTNIHIFDIRTDIGNTFKDIRIQFDPIGDAHFTKMTQNGDFESLT